MALTREVGEETMLFHHDSTDRVVGLLSLTSRTTSHFSPTTRTPAMLAHLSTDQLDRAMQVEPKVAVILAATAVTRLEARPVRSGELQIERNHLIRKLEKERADLAEALTQSREGRLELVTQARFATLSEMSAGIAHELNNPVAALVRSTEQLLDDVTSCSPITLVENPARGRCVTSSPTTSSRPASTPCRTCRTSTRRERCER